MNLEGLKNINDLPEGITVRPIQWPLRFRTAEDGSAYLENPTMENLFKYSIPTSIAIEGGFKINPEYRDAPIEMAILMTDRDGVRITFKREK